VKQCEADIVSMSMMQRPSLGYEPPADKLYDQPLLGFVRTKNAQADEKQLSQNTVEATLNLQNKLSLENSMEDDSGSCTSSDEDGLWREADPKMGPEERKAARKENKKKVKEEKREARKTKIPKAEKKKRKKMAKAKCKR
jgi:RIO kinase 1